MAANRLISGPLQLAKDQGTCLLLDETAMQQGRLDDHGCRNLRASCKLWLKARQVSSTVAILSFLSRGALLTPTNDVPTRIWNRIHPPLIQSVEYDFVYSKAVWPADVPTVTISSGPPMLKCKFHVPLKPTYPEGKLTSSHAAAQQAAASSVPGLLDRARAFLASVRMLSYSGMDSEAQKAVESAFVGARQANPKVGQDDLHEWITHARLIALSHGESKLTLRRWQESREMEGLRKQQLVP